MFNMKWLIALLLCLVLTTSVSAQYYGSSSQVVRANQHSYQTIARLPGNFHPGPHPGCLMCLGNHLISSHGQPYSYLNQISYNQWSTLHDNLHNSRQQAVPQIVNTTPIFAPTPLEIVRGMLKLVRPTENDILYDLGCGDGRIVMLAAKTYGCRAVGIEIDPELAQLAQNYIYKHKVENLAQIFRGDFLKTDISKATIITLYLERELNEKLIPKLKALPAGVKIISYLHDIPNIKPNTVINNEVFFYITPLQFIVPNHTQNFL